MSSALGESRFPDLCRMRRLATILAMAQIATVIVALAPSREGGWTLTTFLSVSGYALWLALLVSVLLCRAKRLLFHLNVGPAILLALLAVAILVAIVSTVVHGLFAGVDTRMRLPSLVRFVTGSVGITVLLTWLAMHYFSLLDRWQAQVAASARAEADALQARIRPHFLFNSMNMIAGLLPREPALAERAVLDLSDLFRAALGAGETSTLAEELDLAERYLAIEQLRFGDRLVVRWERMEPLPWALPLPRLLLQPVLENAVLHGISRLSEGGVVEIRLASVGGQLVIRVRNPVPSTSGRTRGAGHALKNISNRLTYMFGAGAAVECYWEEGSYTCELRIPSQLP